jgi:outer membrane immunogenic protein
LRTVSSTLLGALAFGAVVFGAVAFGAVSAVALAAPAEAADLTPNYYTAPAPYYASGWAGPYIGATAGYEWGTIDNSATHPSGFAGGVEAGWNWQNASFVYGGETDFNVSGAEDTFAPYQFSNPWFGTVRGRAGFAFNNVLIFGTAGFSYGELTADTSGNLSESHMSFGWVAGVGAEVSFTRHWSAKAEWLYLDLADRDFSVTGTNNGLAANLVRLGLNYHF